MTSNCEINYEENYAWVDQRLQEMFHNYGMTEDNFDDYIESGLLKETSSWMDEKLQSQYDIEFINTVPCPAPIQWVLYKNYDSQHCLEEEAPSLSKSRVETDIPDHSAEVERILKRTDCQLQVLQCMTPINYLSAIADEADSVDETFGSCSSISNWSCRIDFDVDDVYEFDYD